MIASTPAPLNAVVPLRIGPVVVDPPVLQAPVSAQLRALPERLVPVARA